MGQISAVARAAGIETLELTERDFRLRDWTRRLPMLNLPYRIWQLNRQARRELAAADIVISHGMYGAFVRHPGHIYVLHSTFAGMAEAMRGMIPTLDYLVCRYLWGGLERLNTGAPTSVAVSGFVQAEARRFYGRSSGIIIPNGVSSSALRQPSADERRNLRRQLDLPENARILLVVGRRERLKGWHLLNTLAPQLPKDLVILSVGSGPPSKHPAIIVQEPVTGDELKRFYRASDWVLSPSIYEGFGLTLLEAWASSVPVLAAPTGLAHDLLGENAAFDACVAQKTNCSDSLLGLIVRATQDPDLGAKQLAWARTLIETRFSQASFSQKWNELLTKHLNAGHDRGTCERA